MLFICIIDPHRNNKYWNSNGSKLLSKLKKLGKVYAKTASFSEWRTNTKKKFDLEEATLKGYCEYIYEDIKHIKDKWFIIGQAHGNYYARYFANMYHSRCVGMILIENRLATKENYEKFLFILKEGWQYKYDIDEYFGKKFTNKKLHALLKDAKYGNDEYEVINVNIKNIIRGSYKLLPDKMSVPTYMFNRLTIDVDASVKHQLINNPIAAKVKDISTVDDAIWQDCIHNIKVVKNNNKLLKKNKNKLKIHYVVSQEEPLLRSIEDDIIDRIILMT